MAKDENNQTDADNENFGLHPCVKCGGRDFQTLYTRDAPRYRIRRRKECRNCGHRFTTYEETKLDDES